MPEPSAPHFEHGVLESDIHRLALEVEKHRERPELRGVSDREIVKMAVQSLSQAATTQDDDATSSAQKGLPAYLKDAPPEAKLEVEYLVDLAFHKGIEKANSVAKGANPYVLDAFHDTLVSFLYPELQKRGIVK